MSAGCFSYAYGCSCSCTCPHTYSCTYTCPSGRERREKKADFEFRWQGLMLNGLRSWKAEAQELYLKSAAPVKAKRVTGAQVIQQALFDF